MIECNSSYEDCNDAKNAYCYKDDNETYNNTAFYCRGRENAYEQIHLRKYVLYNPQLLFKALMLIH